MVSGSGGQMWTLIASNDAVPYGVLAATVSIGIILIGGLTALAVKGRTGLPHGLKRHPTPPLPDPVLGHAKRQAQIADRPADRPPSTDFGEKVPVNGAAPNGVTPQATAPALIESQTSAAEPHEDVSPGSV
ncbi:MAG: hypothetical protein ACLP6E_05740 [Acidimicrobiales bacterium]|jgi:hypothetical protein